MEFLHAEGTRIVNESGAEVLLTGYAFGNWMIQEAFLFGTGSFNADFKPFMRSVGMDRGRTIDQTIREVCGDAYARAFWPRFWRAYLSEDDIAYLAEQGFNCVRLPLVARNFLLEEPGYHWNEVAFEHLSDVLGWCEKHGVYAVLDLHAATAGQSAIGCDDGWDNQPHLFTDEDGAERTCRLWEEFTRRYADRACVAGYELLNEPLALPFWDGMWPELLAFYRTCVDRVRAIDQKHIIFLQGGRFAHRSDMLEPNMDPAHNWVCTYHIYETLPDLGLLGPILAERERLGVPIWVGETGGSAPWMCVLYEMLRVYGIGVNIWVAKAVERPNAPTLLTYQTPEGFDEICAYALEGGPRPSYERAQQIWDAYLDCVPFAACVPHPEQAHAILRTPDVEIPAIGYDVLPGKGRSFSGDYPYCTYCGYRREDPMEFVLADDGGPYEWSDFAKMAKVPKYGDFLRLALRLHAGDFACYTLRQVPEFARLDLRVRAYEPAVLEIEAGSEKWALRISDATWSYTQPMPLPVGDVVVRLNCTSGAVDVMSVRAATEV